MSTELTNLSQIIRSDCVIYCPNGQIVESSYINTMTNVYKKNLYDKLNGKTVGKVGLIWSNKLDVLLPCIKAMWQMGCVVSVHDISHDTATHPSFENFYKNIDFVIGTPDSQSILPHLPHLAAFETKLNYLFFIDELSEPEIVPFVDEDFPDIDYDLDQPLTKDSIAVIGHTSGTTGEPLLCEISHADALDLVKENIRIFDFTDSDRVGHHKTLHHGSLFLNYAIPAFSSTKHHFWFLETVKSISVSGKFLEWAMKFCADNKLTKFLLQNAFLSVENFDKSQPIDINGTSLITIVGPDPHLMQRLFDMFNPTCVYNNFGCTEVGTIAVSKTHRDNLHDYHPFKFNIANNKLDIKKLDRSFLVKYKSQEIWREIGDIIEITDGKLVYHGRNTQLKMNSKLFSIVDLNSFINQRLQIKEFSLVPDFTREQLYIAFYIMNDYHTWTLEKLNLELGKEFGELCIHKTSFFTLAKFFNGIKPSQPLLLHAFRNQNTI